MDHLVQPELHVVAKVVEAELVVGAVCHVRRISIPALGIGQAVDDAAYRQTEEAIDRSHPLGIAPSQVVVDGDDVHALGRERVEIDRKGRDQCLAFARLHLGDHAAVQDDATHHLDIEVALAERSFRRLPDRGKRVDEEIIDRRAAMQSLAEPGCARAQLVVGHRLELWLDRVDRDDVSIQPFQELFVGGAEQPPSDRS